MLCTAALSYDVTGPDGKCSECVYPEQSAPGLPHHLSDERETSLWLGSKHQQLHGPNPLNRCLPGYDIMCSPWLRPDQAGQSTAALVISGELEKGFRDH